MFSFRRNPSFIVSPSSAETHQLFLGWESSKEFTQVAEGKAKEDQENLKFLHLQSLVEQGIGNWDKETNPRGVLMEANEACLLSRNLKSLFEFPQEWQGKFKLVAPEPTHSPEFSARIDATPKGGRATSRWTRKGNLLMMGSGDEFSLNAQELSALLAYENWQAIGAEKRSEADNQVLLARLQRSTWNIEPSLNDLEQEDLESNRGAKIDIGFTDLEFGEEEWEISIKETPEGGLQLVPTPMSDESVNPDDILRRLDQLQYGNEQATVRLHKKIITLTKEQTKRTRDILRRGKLNPQQKKEFLKDPSAYLAEYVFDPDDIEWSPRVKGISEWEGSIIDPNVDGGMGMNILGVEKKEPTTTEEGLPKEESSRDEETTGEARKKLDKYLPYPHLNLTSEEFSECLATERLAWGATHPKTNAQKVDESIFNEGISLKPHQDQGVRWMMAHAHAIDSTATQDTPVGAHFAESRGGVLLADDMGLGKTISVLSFIAMRQKQLKSKGMSGAFLIVAPVSLLLNWKAELDKFFRHQDIFDRTVILHTDHDLEKHRTHPGSADQLQESDDASTISVKCLGLKVSNGVGTATQGIDSPGSLVITNYETIRRFRFSFCAAKWEVLALDEAQVTKNPNVMTTASIKALNARFRVLLTGTPVENSLVDFWCLNDTHSPGLICSLRDFRENYITRIRRADSEDHQTRLKVASEVKAIIGETMLRRMKKDILDKDFPKKIEHRFDTDTALDEPMKDLQLQKYETTRIGLYSEDTSDHHLALLYELRMLSLHPNLTDEGDFPIGRDKNEASEILRRSVKGRTLLDTILPSLKGVNGGEKVLIFALSKSLQWGLARNLEVIFPELGRIPIINGDTKIKSTKTNPSRQKLIDDFEKKRGFHICILSPVAAGVGLTITAANHVVHFERHWNPAKEAQATDRAYRIGQTKDVHVWYPIARHPDPEVTSFDQALDRLMQRKISLQDSILNVEGVAVDQTELMESILGQRKQNVYWTAEKLRALDPLEFEALIACLYRKMGASRTDLTIKSGDKGADVIAWNFPESGSHCLVDAKHSSINGQILGSAQGVRQVFAAGSIYSRSLGEIFNILHVVTNCASAKAEVNRQATACNVAIQTGGQLLDMLANHEVTSSDIKAKLTEPRLSIR